MIKRIVLTAAAVAVAGVLSTPAEAGHCPRDVKALQTALASMDKAKASIAKEAAAKGLALHQSGKHGESLKVLHGAMKQLGIKH